MSLNWSTEKVKYFKDNPDELWVKYRAGEVEEYDDVNIETKSLIFGTMAVCMNEITWSKAPEFYARWKVLEKLDNFYVYSTFLDGESVKTYLTPNMVVKHLGLGTNASRRTKTDWIYRLVESFKKEVNPRIFTVAEISKIMKEAEEEFVSKLSIVVKES